MLRISTPRVLMCVAALAALGMVTACSEPRIALDGAAAVTTTEQPAPTSTVPVVVSDPVPTVVASTAVPTTLPAQPRYTFPFIGRAVSYGRSHHDYPASDVFGCGAFYVAPTSGTILETSTDDLWDPDVDDPATRGGLFVSLLGDDGVRYYAAHLEQVLVSAGQVVPMGEPLGVIGKTGNARASACHLHFGISRPCKSPEWAVRRGEIWPYTYLDAWRNGEHSSPALAVVKAMSEVPDACLFAENATSHER